MTAYQMYRQTSRTRVRGALVLQFLLQTEEFPRSVAHCIAEVKKCFLNLPNNELVLREVGSLQRLNNNIDMKNWQNPAFMTISIYFKPVWRPYTPPLIRRIFYLNSLIKLNSY